MSLSKSAILEAEDLPRREVHVPEWGGSVFIRMMTGSERDAFEERQIKAPYRDLRARLAAAVCCDEAGNLLFGENDLPALCKKSGRALDRVFSAASRHNGLTSADIEELKKNS
jgi:hypothetical protein